MNRITFFLEGLVIYNYYFCLLRSNVYIRDMREASKILNNWMDEAESYGWINWPFKKPRSQ